MRPKSLFRLIHSQLNAHPLKRVSSTIIQKQIKKNQHELSNIQLLSLYRQIIHVCNQPLYSSQNKKQKYNNQDNQHQKQQQDIQIESSQYLYQKKVFTSLEQIVFRNRHKNESEITQVDPTALHYYRLLSAIKFKLPFQHIIQPFKQNFFLHDFSTEIVDYLSILLVTCSSHKQQIEQVASFILAVLKEQLPNINLKQYVYIKFVLQNSKYLVDNSLKSLLDNLIDDNLHLYDYIDIAKFMKFKNKTLKTIQRFAFLQKHQVNQRVSYSYLQKLKRLSSQNIKQKQNQDYIIPGDALNEQTIIKALQYQSNYYSNLGDLQLFQDLISHQNQSLPNLKLLKLYVDNQFQVISGFFSSPQNQKLVTIKSLKCFLKVVQNTIKQQIVQQDPIEKVLKIENINIVKLKIILWFYQKVSSKFSQKQLKQSQEKNININNLEYLAIFNQLKADESNQKIQKKGNLLDSSFQKIIINLQSQIDQKNDEFSFLKSSLQLSKYENLYKCLKKLSDSQIGIILTFLLQRLIKIKKIDKNPEQSHQQKQMLQMLKVHGTIKTNKSQNFIINKVLHIAQNIEQIRSKK